MNPNFFIVGAPKCGTTALVEYLSAHPNVFISEVKEPHYFADDLPSYRYVTRKEDYLALFAAAGEVHLAVGEASVFYLFSEVAIRRIKSYYPAARIIVMLRNPADMVPSLHSQLLYSRDESVENFAEAWNLISQRKSAINVPKSCRDAKLLEYDRVARYGDQLERLYAAFSRDQVLVIFYEDFVGDLPSVYGQVLRFLELPDDGRTDFPVVNANKRHRWAVLAQLTEKTPRQLVNSVMQIKRLLGIRRLGVIDALRDVNRVNQQRRPLDEELRLEVVKCYRRDIQKLSSLVGRDLGKWMQ